MLVFLVILLFLATIGIVAIYFYGENKNSKLKQALTNLESNLKSSKAKLDEDAKIIKELTHNNLAENQLNNLSSPIIKEIPIGIICIDQTGMVALINKYAERFVEIFPAEGKSYQQTLHLMINGVIDFSYFDLAFTGKKQTLPENAELVTQTGKISIAGNIIPLSVNDSVNFVVFVFFDNSQNTSRIQQEKNFFSTVAHELRTPLSAIRLTMKLLLQQSDTLGKEKIMEYLKKTDNSAEYLTNLVNDFLNLSRIEQGKLTVEKKSFNLVTLTDEVIKELTPLVKQRGLFIEHEPIEESYFNVIGDPIKIKEILTNIIGNGIKYTIQGGITVSHHVTSTTLVTKIADTGSGIPSDSQQLLFKRFMQIGYAREQSTTKGSGLGLYISKKIAKLMNGDVALESSEPGKGSVFTLSLPLDLKNVL